MVHALVAVQGGLERPHEILGLAPETRDPTKIVGAALAKLRVIRASNGSDVMVRRAVEAAVIEARDRLLAEAFGHCAADFPETSPMAVGAGSAPGGGTFRGVDGPG